VNARKLLLGAVLASLGVLGGCKGMLKKKGDDAAASASVAAAAAPAPVVPAASAALAAPAYDAAPPPVALDENAVPAPQDFEDEAFEKVTPANFRAELARLQKEINQ